MKKRSPKRLLLVLVLLGCGGCQFLQNEFFFLDKAAPAPAASARPGLGTVQ